MKKLFALVITMVMIMSTAAFAASETIDLAEMTQEELTDLINRARTEMRKFANESGSVIFDDKGIVMKYSGVDFGFMGLEIKLIIENNSGNEVLIQTDKMYINGWEIQSFFGAEVESGKKNKKSITILNAEEEAEVSSIADLESAEFIIKIIDPKSYKTLYESDKITINF